MKIAVVVPCYKVKRHIKDVLSRIPSEVTSVYVVDDACPEKTGSFVEANNKDPRVSVIYLPKNQGVGGAVLRGFSEALEDGADILVKLDGDGQMDPAKIEKLISPIVEGKADFTKGNRFYSPSSFSRMPIMRFIGNSVLSIMTKFTTGYWDLMDPTNGYVAVHAKAFALLPTHKISRGFFFETDMLFRLALSNCVVQDVALPAIYGDEKSNLKVVREGFNFLGQHLIRFPKRLAIQYFVQVFRFASLSLVFGSIFLILGLYLGISYHQVGLRTGIPTEGGKRTIVVILLLVGIQLFLEFVAVDKNSHKKEPLHKSL